MLVFLTEYYVGVIERRRIRLARHVARVEEKRNSSRVLMGKLEGKRKIGKHSRRWQNNIRVDFKNLDRTACI